MGRLLLLVLLGLRGRLVIRGRRVIREHQGRILPSLDLPDLSVLVLPGRPGPLGRHQL